MVWTRSRSHFLKADSKRWIFPVYLQAKVEIVNTLPHHIVDTEVNWPIYGTYKFSCFATPNQYPWHWPSKSRSEAFLFGRVSSKIVNHARDCTVWVVE